MARLILYLVLLFSWGAHLSTLGDGDFSDNAEVNYANTLQSFLIRSCMYGFGISGMRSTYDPSKRDRLWRIDCKRVGFRGGETCKWTLEFKNEFGQRLDHVCDRNYYIAGLYSDYNVTRGDRVWRIECCHSPGVLTKNCKSTNYTNSFEGNMNFRVEPSKVIRRIHSYFDSSASDRRWRFDVCNVKRKERPSRYNDPTDE